MVAVGGSRRRDPVCVDCEVSSVVQMIVTIGVYNCKNVSLSYESDLHFSECT